MTPTDRLVRRRRPDFGGVGGNLALLIALPLITFGLWAAVRLNHGSVFLWRIDAEGWRDVEGPPRLRPSTRRNSS